MPATSRPTRPLPTGRKDRRRDEGDGEQAAQNGEVIHGTVDSSADLTAHAAMRNAGRR